MLAGRDGGACVAATLAVGAAVTVAKTVSVVPALAKSTRPWLSDDAIRFAPLVHPDET
jgi:hypothetical protein